MAGVFFEVFLLLVIMAVGLTLFGFWKQKIVVLPIAVILFILSGGILLSQGLLYESGGTYDSTTGIISYTFSTVDSSDPSVMAIGISFVVIGIILALIFFRIGAMGGEE